MELKLHQRTGEKKSQTKQLRRSGLIPAVIYKKGSEGEKVAIEAPAFAAFLRELKPGYLPTTRLKFVGENGKHRQAIVKEIQYHPTTYQVLHLDLLELEDKVAINVKIPIECVGTMECVGVKQGGILRQVIRYMRVRCLPKDLPTGFTLDVRDVSMAQSRRLKDVPLTKGVQPLDKLEEVCVVVAKR